jgi:hypothetical protein
MALVTLAFISFTCGVAKALHAKEKLFNPPAREI